jgi:hypothetical protein
MPEPAVNPKKTNAPYLCHRRPCFAGLRLHQESTAVVACGELGSLVGNGTYRAIDTSLYGSTPVSVIVFGQQNYQVYQLAFLTLVIGVGDEAYDGEQSTYIKAN